MRYLSVCSGIEAATVAWHSLGWTPVAFSEIDAFPCAVLAYHFPTVPNWGDMTRFHEWPDATFDVLVGGTPCQAFSVAGLRKGLDDPRGNLALTYLAIVDRYRPEWMVWENVPGVLSQDKGRAFGAFVGGLAELGYGWAYRVLDAQYFGLAQRRKRVFVVGHRGDWRRAAAVLFERESLSGHPAPRREAWEEVTCGVRRGVAGSLSAHKTGGWGVTDIDVAGAYLPETTGPIAGCSNGGGANGPGRTADDADSLLPVVMSSGQANAEIVRDGSPSLTCLHEAPILAHALRGISDYGEGLPSLRAKGGDCSGGSELLLAYALRADGFDASEDGTGRGTPLVVACEIADTLTVGANQTYGRTCCDLVALQAFDARQSDVCQYGDQSGPLDTDGHTIAIAFDPGQSSNPKATHQYCEEHCPPLIKERVHAIAFSQNSRDEVRWQSGDGQIVGALAAEPGMKQTSYIAEPYTLAVRGRGDGRDLETRQDGTANALLTPNGGRDGVGIGAVAFEPRYYTRDNKTGGAPSDVAVIKADASKAGDSSPHMATAMQVRRLTPRECERLQGFSDNYTLIPYRGKPAADGPRYKALGNSMAVPCMKWLGDRIQLAADTLGQN